MKIDVSSDTFTYLFDACFHLPLPSFFSETGEAFLEEYPNNKRDQKTLEELILKRVQLGTRFWNMGGALSNIFKS